MKRLPGALALILVVACSPEKPPAQKPAPQVTIVTVAPQTIPYVMSFVAQTESSRQVDIVARVSGYLDKIAYREGELVQEGQLLFELDPRPFRAQLDAARGELKAQQARLATARANLGRIGPLAKMDAMSRADLDKAQGEFDSANAAVFAAQAKVREQELNLGYTTIKSPVTGLASRSAQRQGAYINAQSDGAKLTYVAALDPVWVNFSVSQNQTTKLKDMVAKKQVLAPPNQEFEVEITLSDGAVYAHKGRINFADPSFSQETGSFLVRAELPNPDKALRPGMFVTARVSGATRPNAIVVPQLAVQQGSKGHLVYVIKPDNVAELRPVVVGDYQGDKDIVIVEGLKPGERVAVDGVLQVVPGKPVKIAAPGAKDASQAAAPAKK